jgi:hypothetical protein
MLPIAFTFALGRELHSPEACQSAIIMPYKAIIRKATMRMLTLCWIVFAFTLAGCYSSHECATKSTAQTNKDCCPTGDCCPGDCCSPPSRAQILNTAEEADKDAKAIELKTVKFDAFMKDVKAHNGKVVCAYLWTNASGPSKKNLPLLLELQQKHAAAGLVCLTVSSDAKDASTEALKHLESAKCALANYRQADDDVVDGWTKCFGCCGFPVLIVFGRDGKQAASFEVTELPFEAATIEKTLVKLLNSK